MKEKEDTSLYKFCYNIRYARKHPEKSDRALTYERIASLDALGFNWSARQKAATKSFAQRIADLRAYKEKQGHINVRQSEDISLYEFCSKMRHARNNPEKSNTLINEERMASLDALGFDWTERAREQAAKKSFEQRIEDLQVYKEKHGHTNVKSSNDKSLHKFCERIRYAHKHPEKSTMLINEERIASLDDLGFNWSIQAATQSFAQRIEDLKAYKEKHGHVNVKDKEDMSLYEFCKGIRHARKNPGKSNTLINEERIASLDALGFDWRASYKFYT